MALAPPIPPPAAPSVIPSAATASSPPVCTPGQAGIPDSFVGELACGRYLSDVPSAAWVWILAHGPLAAAALAALVAARLAWVTARRRAWRNHAAGARWLEIAPPVTATPGSTVQLWRLLATLLPAPGRFAARPARIAWEVRADPDGMRCGLWVPPGVNPTAVRRVLGRAWPGARLTDTVPPALPAGRSLAAQTLVASRDECLPLLEDDPHRPRRRTPVGGAGLVAEEDDLLRAVYDGLASAGRTGGGMLQVVVGRAPGRRVAALRRAASHPGRPRRTPAGHAAGLLAGAARGVVTVVLDLVTTGPSTRTTRPPHRSSRGGHLDPLLAEQARHALAKYGAGPHLLVAVRAVAAGPSSAAARAAVADITSGYSLLTTRLHRRRLRRPHTTVTDRHTTEPGMVLATVAEVAALAGLPAEPAVHGLPAAAARRRMVTRDTWRPTETPDTSSAARTCAPPDPPDPPPDDPDPDPGVTSADPGAESLDVASPGSDAEGAR